MLLLVGRAIEGLPTPTVHVRSATPGPDCHLIFYAAIVIPPLLGHHVRVTVASLSSFWVNGPP
jgi:hypothetical protein